MRVRGSNHLRIGHPGQGDVIDEAPLASEKSGIFNAANRFADAG